MTDPEFERYHQQSRAELIADVINDTEQVIHGLEIQREADIINRRFMFSLEDTSFVLPPSIRRSISPDSTAVQLFIDVEQSRLKRTGSVSIQIEFSGAKDFIIFINPGDEGREESHEATMVFVNDLNAPEENPVRQDAPLNDMPLLDPITTAEVNRLIASLIAANKTHDYTMFDRMDLRQERTVHHVAEALEEKADSTLSDMQYFTDKILALDSDSIRFSKMDGIVTYATVQRSLVSGAIAAMITIDGIAEPHDDVSVQSAEGIRAFSTDIDGEPMERDVDFDVLVSIHDFLRSQKATMFEPEIRSLETKDEADVSTNMNVDDLGELRGGASSD